MNSSKNIKICSIISVILLSLLTNRASVAGSNEGHSEDLESAPAILIIGASFANGVTPFNSDLAAPLGGISVNLGSFLSLGNALVRSPYLAGHVINEAQAGATSFDRVACNPGPECSNVGWDGLDKQYDKALARVSIPDSDSPDTLAMLNAEYLVISFLNDCLHPDAFGIPMSQTQECSVEEINNVVDNLIDVANRAVDVGLTPVIISMPEYQKIDFDTFQATSGFSWIISEENYNLLSDIRDTRISAEVPEALLVNAWERFTPLADGLHPDRNSTLKAANKVVKAMRQHKRRGN